ncbi:Protoheme IX farnesyltransferase 2 [uncultured Gammaproteobacteria bacterium]
MPVSFGQLCSVFKLRIGVAIAFTALAGLAVTPGGSAVPLWKVAVLVLAVLMASASAGAFNQYIERDYDHLMARTRNRPFVTGALRPGWHWPALMATLLTTAVTLAGLALGSIAALHVFLGAFFYGVVYTVWLKRRGWINIVIGGLAGSFAVLAGAASADGVGVALAPASWLFAAVLFLWTPPHFWSLAMAKCDDYAAAGIPMLPVVVGDRRAAQVILAHTLALVGVSLLPAAFGLGPIYLACAAVGGALFCWRSVRLALAPGKATAMANFYASLIQLCLLLVGAYSEFWLQ